MDTKQDKATTGSPSFPIREGDGLFLRGLVVAVEKIDRKWENEEYKQLKATIVDGKHTFFFVVNDKAGPLPPVIPFTHISIEVDWAAKEKGIMTVRGSLMDD